MHNTDTPSSLTSSLSEKACHPSGRGEVHIFNFYKKIPKNFTLLSRARDLRKAGYFHEMRLWKKLKGKQLLGLDFNRQQVIGNYIVDFVCYRVGLIIEADGSSHIGREEYDRRRDRYLKSLGFKILRIPVIEIFKNINNVVKKIKGYVEALPLSQRGGIAVGDDGVSQPRNVALPKKSSFAKKATLLKESDVATKKQRCKKEIL